MKLIIAAAVIALAFTTGFTCSKNAPTTEAPVTTDAPAMPADTAAPVEAAPTPPTDGPTPPAPVTN